MARWRCTALATLLLALLCGTAVWAQGPAPAKPAESASIVWVMLLAPTCFILIIIFALVRRASKMNTGVDRSLELGEESIRLLREQVALQKETNRLLANLLDAMTRE